MLKAGLVGLPNAGKTTLFNALTRAHAPAENYPFTTIEPNTGTVIVPDHTLQELATLLQPHKVVPAHIEFQDIAGLVKDAHRGEGLGNQFLSHIRGVNAIVHVVRCFESDSVSHVAGSLDPVRDWEVVETELMLADLELLERHLARTARLRNRPSSEIVPRLNQLKQPLEKGVPLRRVQMDGDLRHAAREHGLLTWLPELAVANLGENDKRGDDLLPRLQRKCQAEGVEVIGVYAQLEYELLDLEEEERKAFLQTFHLTQGATERIIHAAYRLLDLITFYTVENEILQAWTAPRGTLAPDAAGLIHSDMREGFVAADVVSARDLIRYGSFAEARQHGCLRREGKHYEIRPGDVCRFHFH